MALQNLWVIFVGGILPAFFWGVTAIFQKQSSVAVGPAVYLFVFGAAAALFGLIWTLMTRPAFSMTGIGFAGLAGLTFAAGTGLISYALFAYSTPLSKLAPIWSANVLVTLAIAVALLGEGTDLNLYKVFGGTALIIGGVLLVTNA